MASPLINGQNYAWADVKVVVLAGLMLGITEINYSRKRGTVNNYGIGAEPVSYGNTNVTYDGSDLTVYFDEIENLRKVAPDGDITKIPPFPIIVMFGGGSLPLATHTLQNCRFTEDNFTAKQGDSMFGIKLPFVFAGLKKV